MFTNQRRATAFYQDCFNTPAGKEVIADMCGAHHFQEPTYVSGAGDGMANALESAFREGERNVILRIMANLGWGIPDIEEMLKQHVRNEADRGEFDDNFELQEPSE